jgi:arsenical pump membrane protein
VADRAGPVDIGGRPASPAVQPWVVSRVADQLSSLAPALAFLLAGVPLAALLDDLGFFDAAAVVVVRRRPGGTPIAWLWTLAALTTAVLNLDTTVVLLTPLYVRMARRSGQDPFGVAVVPLLLAAFASSVLPVSNLTNLIVVDRLGADVADVLVHVALPSLAAVAVGWFVYRRRWPIVLVVGADGPPDRRALAVGGVIVAALLLGFVLGPSVGVAPWMCVVVADLVLVAVTRTVPWREVPIATAALVAAIAAAVAVVVPSEGIGSAVQDAGPAGLVVVAGSAAVAANAVNNLPALLVVVDGVDRTSWGVWAWLLGVNVGSVLVPLGALANLLWWRIARVEGVEVDLRRYVRTTVPVALPALVAAIAVLVAERLAWP